MSEIDGTWTWICLTHHRCRQHNIGHKKSLKTMRKRSIRPNFRMDQTRKFWARNVWDRTIMEPLLALSRHCSCLLMVCGKSLILKSSCILIDSWRIMNYDCFDFSGVLHVPWFDCMASHHRERIHIDMVRFPVWQPIIPPFSDYPSSSHQFLLGCDRGLVTYWVQSLFPSSLM